MARTRAILVFACWVVSALSGCASKPKPTPATSASVSQPTASKTGIPDSTSWIYPIGSDAPSYRWDADTQQWIQTPGGNPRLAIRTNDFSGKYPRSGPIPVVMEVKRLRANEPPQSPALSHLYVTLWFDDNAFPWSDSRHIENGLRFDADDTWRHEFDLAKRVGLEPGTYTIRVGIGDSDWTGGALRSNPHAIMIVADKD